MKIVFFGTPFFAAQILQYLMDKKISIVAIVTRVDKPLGRSSQLKPSVVKALAIKAFPHIPIFQPVRASSSEFVETLKIFKPDLFVVAAYGKILTPELLAVPRILPVNVHPSLLPKYRGATPIQSALMQGDQETGVTIMEMVKEMDAGDVLDSVKISLDDQINFGELEKKLCDLSGPALLRVFEKIKKNTLVKTPQNPELATYSKKIVPEDRKIHWNQPAQKIHNQIRALSPKPGAYCELLQGSKRKKFMIYKSHCVEHVEGNAGETLSLNSQEWIMKCGKGALSLERVQLEGKKTLSIQEFLRGTASLTNIILA